MAVSVSQQITEILAQYEETVRKTAEKDIEKVAKDTVQRLKQTSPKDTGDYAKSWTLKRDARTKTVTVYNKDHYRLTHLLENGYMKKNQFGSYGRQAPQKHIGPAEKEAVEELMKKIEEDLNR